MTVQYNHMERWTKFTLTYDIYIQNCNFYGYVKLNPIFVLYKLSKKQLFTFHNHIQTSLEYFYRFELTLNPHLYEAQHSTLSVQLFPQPSSSVERFQGKTWGRL